VWRIVGPDEFDLSQGKISCDSPLGRALLGQPVGNDIQLETPEGHAYWALIAVEYR
jgi:transcription elongation factor GreB